MANDIDALMERLILQSLNKIADFAVDEMRENVADAAGRNSQMYKAVDRTKVRATGNELSVEVAIETDRIVPRAGGGCGFSHYMSLNGATSYGGASMGNWVTSWFEYGVSPHAEGKYLGNQPISARHMVKRAYDTTAKAIPGLVKSIIG